MGAARRDVSTAAATARGGRPRVRLVDEDERRPPPGGTIRARAATPEHRGAAGLGSAAARGRTCRQRPRGGEPALSQLRASASWVGAGADGARRGQGDRIFDAIRQALRHDAPPTARLVGRLVAARVSGRRRMYKLITTTHSPCDCSLGW